MKWIYLVLTGALLFIQTTAPAQAHGVKAELTTAQATQITAIYDDGTPMQYSQVEITRRGDRLPFQTGYTDRNGRFLFLLDGPGEWEITVNDGLGHQVSLNSQGASPTPSPQTARTPHSLDIVTGLGLIFGIFGLITLLKHRPSPTGKTP